MSIDTNDIKILIHSSLQLLMKSCWQCLKDHPIISILLLVFLSFYIFMPSLFNLFFYTSPLVICTAILLQGKFQFMHQNIRTNKSDDVNDKATMETQISPRESAAQNRKLRPTIQAAMSRRTFKKRTSEELGTILMADLKVDFIIRSFSDEMPLKLREKKVSYGSDDSVNSSPDYKKKGEAEKPSDAVKIDAETQKDDKIESKLAQEKEKNKPVVEWKEEDQKNHMDLGSSDIEWNKRLENLIAKRRARKMFNMLPQKNPIKSVANDFQGHAVTPIKTERNNNDTEGGGQPGSAPSVLLPINPFDLPYDPSEEKPVLTGDGFEEEIFITQPKDMHYCRHESFTYGPSFFTQHFEDPHYKSDCSLFTNRPIASSIGPGLPRYRRQSDAGVYGKHASEQSSQESENLSQTNEQIPHEVQLKNMQNNRYEEANISAQNLHASQEENVSLNGEYANSMLLEPRDSTKEQEERQDNTLAMQSNVSVGEETEMNPDFIHDDNDETSSSSSLEANADIASASADVAVAVKNETFRNSVKKVLAVIQKNRSIPPLYPPSASDSFDDSTPRYVHPTKMEERSFYTRPTHHLSYSIASDMQVEASDGPNSPTDVESLVFDRDEDDQDGDDSDEDSQRTPRETRSEQAECSEQNLNNSHDTDIGSSNAEERMVKASNMLNVDDHDHQECVNQDTDFGSIQSRDDSIASPTQRLLDNNNNNSAPMVGSASTSTEQNIDTYINLPSSNDLPNQDPHHQNLQASVSPTSTSSHRSVLQDTITMDGVEDSINTQNSPSSVPPSASDNQGSSAGSSSSPKSVLPETIPVHEFSSSWECTISLSDAPQDDHQTETPNEDSGPAKMHFDSQHDLVPLDEMALRSGDGDSTQSNIQPLEAVPLHDLPLLEDEVCMEASTSLEKDLGEEKSHEKRTDDVVVEPRISVEAQDQTTL